MQQIHQETYVELDVKKWVSTLTTFGDQHSGLSSQNSEIKNGEDKSSYGRWTYDQQVLYLEFAQNNALALENRQNRRSSKVFKQMAKIVISRSADQCRSHHQKMQKKHGSVPQILSYCKRTLERLKIRESKSAKANCAPAIAKPDVKASFQLEIADAKTPMTIHTQGGFDNSSDFLLEDQEFTPIQLGVEEGQSYVLDFMNYDYDQLF